MVTLTEGAIGVIRLLTDRHDLPAGAGVRFANGSSPGSLAVGVTEQPYEGDEVLDTSGVRLFMDDMAARILEGKVLDATIVNGSVRFNVGDGASQQDHS